MTATRPMRVRALITGERRFWVAARGEYPMEQQNCKNKLAPAVMSCSGLARSVKSPHQERQIARRRLNQQFLVHVVAASHVQPVHTSRVKLMRKVPLQPFPASGLQSLSPLSSNPSTNLQNPRLFFLLFLFLFYL